jgi:2-polyprenyl-3-methyl-5-hydroxy-6-metoxy-1,4-benzoquinol methylase
MTQSSVEVPGPDDGGRRLARLDFRRLYDFRFRDVDQGSRQLVWDEVAPFLWNRMGRPARVLDPAGGRGEFVNAVAADERWLVDIVDHAERFVDPAVHVLVGDIFDVDLPAGHFDGIFVSNLLEHLPDPDAVAAFLGRMRELLVPGGALAVMGPNFKYCARDYFDCADHTLALTHVSVEEHLYAADFSVTEVVPRFLPFSFRSRLPSSRALTALYLRSPACWRVLGKQFLLLAERR